jgi:hypothetical protein
MNTIQRLRNQSLLAKILFWTGQIIGSVYSITFLIIAGRNIFDQLNKGVITFKEDILLFIFFFFLIGIAIGLIINWFRSRTGAMITIATTIAAGLVYGLGGDKMFFALLMPLISGILLLLSAYQKEGKS